jgi:outer membrane protein assembly factor BamB
MRALLLALPILAWSGAASAAPTSLTSTTSTATSTTAASPSPSSWTVYHGSVAGTGVAPSAASVDLSSRAWTSPALDGTLYTEPLVLGDRVFVATENDTVYALSASTGAVLWSTHVGTPVPSGDLPCGDIAPTVGITGTPVIDPARSELFAVADELVNGTPAHMLIGVDTSTGKVELTQDVDPSGASPAALLQRTGLTLDAGHVVFGMGGNYGDCATYRGRVFAVPETGGKPEIFTVDAAAGENQGAVWMGGAAPVVDAAGNIWVSTGNGSVYSSSHPYDDSDAVLELSPSMVLEQYFAPSNWPSNNSKDLDMSIAPAVLDDGQVVLAGKSRIVYLLDGAHLGGIGSQQASLGPACSQDIDGGVAISGTTVFLPCFSGPIAMTATSSPPTLHLQWQASVGGGPPLLAAGLVWTIGQNGVVYGLNPATGSVRAHATVGVPANHFPTPSVGAGLFLVPTADHVVAFAAPPTPATPATTTTTSAPTTTSTRASHHASAAPPQQGGGSSAGWIALAAALVVLGVVAGFVLRRRLRSRSP